MSSRAIGWSIHQINAFEKTISFAISLLCLLFWVMCAVPADGCISKHSSLPLVRTPHRRGVEHVPPFLNKYYDSRNKMVTGNTIKMGGGKHLQAYLICNSSSLSLCTCMPLISSLLVFFSSCENMIVYVHATDKQVVINTVTGVKYILTTMQDSLLLVATPHLWRLATRHSRSMSWWTPGQLTLRYSIIIILLFNCYYLTVMIMIIVSFNC